MIWLLATTANAQNGLNIAQLFDGKVIPQERMVETRVKGKMLSKYQLTFFRSARFEAKDRGEINRVHDLIELDLKQHASFTYADNYSSKKSNSKETLMFQLPKTGQLNRFLCYKRKGDEISYTIEIPANCSAKVRLPDGSTRMLTAGTYHF